MGWVSNSGGPSQGNINAPLDLHGFLLEDLVGPLTMPAAEVFAWQNRTRFASPTDGTLTVSASNAANPVLLQLGAATASFPMLKRNGAGVAFRLADDSGDANISAAGATLSGNVAIPGLAAVLQVGSGIANGSGTINFGDPISNGVMIQKYGGGATLRILDGSGPTGGYGSLYLATLYSQGTVISPGGTATGPSFTFTSSQSTGLFSSTVNTLGIATNGVAALTFDASQNMTATGIFTISKNAPSTILPNFQLGSSTADYSATMNFGPVAAAGVRIALYASSFSFEKGDGSAQANIRVNAVNAAGTVTATLLGSAAAPSLVINAGANGLYAPATNQLGISTNGVAALTFDASQNATFTGSVKIGTSDVANPTAIVLGLSSSSSNSTLIGRVNAGPDVAIQSGTGAYAPLSVGRLTAYVSGSNAAAPSINFGDSLTGVYRAGTNQLGISTSGVAALTFDASQKATFSASVIGPNGTANIPAFRTGPIAVAQANTLAVNTLTSAHVYTVTINGTAYSYTATGTDTQQSILTALNTAIGSTVVTGVVTGTGASALLTLTSVTPGAAVTYTAVDAQLTQAQTVANVGNFGWYYDAANSAIAGSISGVQQFGLSNPAGGPTMTFGSGPYGGMFQYQGGGQFVLSEINGASAQLQVYVLGGQSVAWFNGSGYAVGGGLFTIYGSPNTAHLAMGATDAWSVAYATRNTSFFGAQMLNTNGTAAAPSYAFTASTGTGVYSPGAGQLGLASNGVAALTFDASQVATFTGANVNLTTVGANLRVGSGTANGAGILTFGDPTAANVRFRKYGAGPSLYLETGDGSYDGTLFLGTLRPSSGVQLGNGTASAPSLTFAASTGTGMFSPAVNQLGVTVNGAAALTFNSTQNATFTANALFPAGTSVAFGAGGVPSVQVGEATTGFNLPVAGTLGLVLAGSQSIKMSVTGVAVKFLNTLADSYAAGFQFWSGRGGGSATLFADSSNGVVTYAGLASANTLGSGGIIATTGALGWQGADANSSQGLLNGTATLSAALTGTSVTLTNAIPAGSIVLGVACRVITTITGATSFSIGDGTTAAAFGSAIALVAGTTTDNTSWTITTVPFYVTAKNIVLTANGAAFTGGQVRVTVFYAKCVAPGS